MCDLAAPFMDGRIVDIFGRQPLSFAGFDESAIICYSNLGIDEVESLQNSMLLNDPSYLCERNITGWQTDWYSPVCRSWFENQKAHDTQTTVSELYIFSKGGLGLTTC
jgi:hypothetical protein